MIALPVMKIQLLIPAVSLFFLSIFSCNRQQPEVSGLEAFAANAATVDTVVDSGIKKCYEETNGVNLNELNKWSPRGLGDDQDRLSRIVGASVSQISFHYDGRKFTGGIFWLSDKDFIYRGQGDDIGVTITLGKLVCKKQRGKDGFFHYAVIP